MKIPKYVTAMLDERRITLASQAEQAAHPDAYGYTFRLYRYSNGTGLERLEQEAARLTAWARREYAEAAVLGEVLFTVKEHRKPYYKRDYMLLTITDPVALALEKRLEGRRGHV